MNEDMIKQLSEEDKHRKQHPYWVWESIMQIPDMLTLCLQKPVTEQVDRVVQACVSRKINKIILLGRGSSYFSTIPEKYLIESITQIPVISAVTNVFESYPYTQIDSKTAVFMYSHSGKSEGDNIVINKLRAAGAYTVGVTDIADSPLAKTVEDVIIGPGGSKVELPATRTFTSGMFRMMQFALSMAKTLGKEKAAQLYEPALLKVPQLLKRDISRFENIAKEIVPNIQDSSSFIFVAFGPNIATVEEAAMAFNQSTGVPAMSYEMENYIHGPMQALSKTQCLIAIAPKGELQSRMLRLTKAAKIIGAKTVLLAPQDSVEPDNADILIDMPADVPDLLSPLVYMLPLWQIGYHFGLLGRGGHPDRLSMDKDEFKKGFSYLMQADKWVTQK